MSMNMVIKITNYKNKLHIFIHNIFLRTLQHFEKKYHYFISPNTK